MQDKKEIGVAEKIKIASFKINLLSFGTQPLSFFLTSSSFALSKGSTLHLRSGINQEQGWLEQLKHS